MSGGDAPVRCLYEVLGVDRKATSEEIRAAYKKLALVYHPDKNHGSQEEAAVRFKEVQGAYSTLMDAEERQWYDAHRESILKGDSEGTCAPDEINVFDYMTNRCFRGFTDEEGGFFQVYKHLFSTIREEEASYDPRARQFPSFGDSTTPFDKGVSEFYRFWRNFSSFKTFSWKDEVKLSDIPDRQSRRYADRMQEKERNAAKKEYVAAVMHVANFVWKRDPRVKAELERAAEEESKKNEEREIREMESMKRRREEKEKIWAEAAQKEAQDDAEREARGETMDGSTLEMMYERQRQLERLRKSGKTVELAPGQGDVFANIAGDDAPEEVAEAVLKLKCELCKKTFTTNAQWQEHINSSKHKTKAKQAQGKAGEATISVQQPATPAPAVQPKVASKAQDSAINGEDDVDSSAPMEPQSDELVTTTSEANAQASPSVPDAAAARPASSGKKGLKPKKGQPAAASPPSALKNKAPPKRDDDDDDDDEDSPVAPRTGFGAFASLTKKKR